MAMENIIRNIQNRSLNLAVLGCGYVGLPTAVLFADAGFHVTAIDLRKQVMEAINRAACSINEPGLPELLSRNVRAGRLTATVNCCEALSNVDVIILCIQTPLGKNKEPDLSFLMNGIEHTGNIIRKDNLVVIGSTVPPGTSLGVVKPRLEFLSNLVAEEEFYIAYVPERIAPGNALKEFIESPRLVGGIGTKSTKIGAELYRSVCKKVIETNAAVAEVAKLAENTYRDVNIAFANQLALICEKIGADVKEVITLANTHPRVNIHNSGPGVGGPCLTKDPYFLSCSSESLSQDLIWTAREINDYMPSRIVESTLKALEYADKEVRDSRISILGTAYKSEIGDSRLSPAKPVIGQLLHLCAKVTTYDPYSSESFGANNASTMQDAIRNADSIVIMTDHLEFKTLDLEKIRKLMNVRPSIIDGRRIVDPLKAKSLGFIYYGIGFGWLLR